MHPLQDLPGSVSIGEAFIKDRNFGFDDQDSPKELIKLANTAELLQLLNDYGVRIDEYKRKVICPFSFHRNEKTGSFFLYKDTNSFYCFGCKSGGGPVNFVALFDDISKTEAAKKIIADFHVKPNAISYARPDFADRQNILLGFSEMIRNFIHDNLDDKFAIEHCEKVTLIFDTINFRHSLDNEGLKSLIGKLKVKLEQYR